MTVIDTYFSSLTKEQQQQFEQCFNLYKEWNEKINVVSRKDIDSLFEKHFLHSLAIAKFISFRPNTHVLDIGTGGGFPAIPLSIFFPETNFTLCDSIAKKIMVAETIAQQIGLTNTDFVIGRVEQLKEKFDFIVSRAVASSAQLYKWTQSYINEENNNAKFNGYLFLKGGDLREEIKELKSINKKLIIEEYPLSNWFEEDFFETKKLLYIY